MSGKGFRPRPVPLGRWRAPATAFVVTYFLVAVVLPLLVLAYASTQPFYTPPSGTSLSHMSLENYSTVFHLPLARATRCATRSSSASARRRR